MLKVNLASDSTHQCQVASKLGVGHDVGEQIVVSSDNEWFPGEVFLELLSNHPL